MDAQGKDWLSGIEPITVRDGGVIYYKQYPVEFYRSPYDPSVKERLERLVARCQHIEALGLVPSTTLAIWRWEWIEDLAIAPAQLENLLFMYDLYRRRDAEDLVAHFRAALPPSLGLSGQLFLTATSSGGQWMLRLPAGEDDWICHYDAIQKRGYESVLPDCCSYTPIETRRMRDQALLLLEAAAMPADLSVRARTLNKQCWDAPTCISTADVRRQRPILR